MNHPHDLQLSLLTYANNPSPTQITLCQPCLQVTNTEHNNPKKYKSAYCSSTCQDSSPHPGHCLLTIISNSDSDSLTPHLHLYCTLSTDPAFFIHLPCTIVTLLHFCLQITSFTNKSYKYISHVPLLLILDIKVVSALFSHCSHLTLSLYNLLTHLDFNSIIELDLH